MKSVADRIAKARALLLNATNEIMMKNELPAYIMETIIGDVRSDVQQTAVIELISELESDKNVNMAKGIQQEKLAEQAVNRDPDKRNQP